MGIRSVVVPVAFAMCLRWYPVFSKSFASSAASQSLFVHLYMGRCRHKGVMLKWWKWWGGKGRCSNWHQLYSLQLIGWFNWLQLIGWLWVTCSDIRDVSNFFGPYVYTFGRPHQIFLLLRDLRFILEIVTLDSKNSLGGLRYIIIY